MKIFSVLPIDPSLKTHIFSQSSHSAANTHILSSLPFFFGLLLIACNKELHLGSSTGQLRVEEQGTRRTDEARVGGRLPRRQHAALDGATQQVSRQEMPRLVPHHLYWGERMDIRNRKLNQSAELARRGALSGTQI